MEALVAFSVFLSGAASSTPVEPPLHHFRHHFETPLANPGVTSALWGGLLGTPHRGEGRVRVPRRLANDWLIGAGVPPAARGRARR